MADLVIHQRHIVDGTGQPGHGDVASPETITAVAPLDSGASVRSAKASWSRPASSTSTHYDGQVTWDGVSIPRPTASSIVMGSTGVNRPATHRRTARLAIGLLSVEDIPSCAGRRPPWDWESFPTISTRWAPRYSSTSAPRWPTPPPVMGERGAAPTVPRQLTEMATALQASMPALQFRIAHHPLLPRR